MKSEEYVPQGDLMGFRQAVADVRRVADVAFGELPPKSGVLRSVMRVEWSPSRRHYVEILQCGHLGAVRKNKFLGFGPRTAKVRPADRRVCHECK